MRSPLVIGTRGSQLALWQANHVRAVLESTYGVEVQLEVIKTTGDKITDVPLAAMGGTKALFTKEIEEALLAGRADLAVHSMKDLPTVLPEGLTLAAVPAREDPRDALLTRDGSSVEQLPAGARVGTTSLRRQVQLRLWRRDLAIEPLRGNLDTRIRKLDEGRYDAILLAAAGLRRLGWAERISQLLEPERMLPAVGQGALAIETREDDDELIVALDCLRDEATGHATRAERAFLARIGGGCQVPLAAHATAAEGELHLRAVVVSLDANRVVRGEERGTFARDEELGKRLAERLLEQGAAEILAEIETQT